MAYSSCTHLILRWYSNEKPVLFAWFVRRKLYSEREAPLFPVKPPAVTKLFQLSLTFFAALIYSSHPPPEITVSRDASHNLTL